MNQNLKSYLVSNGPYFKTTRGTILHTVVIGSGMRVNIYEPAQMMPLLPVLCATGHQKADRHAHDLTLLSTTWLIKFQKI